MPAKWIEHSERPGACSRCSTPTTIGQRIYWLRRGTILCELCGSLAEHEQPEIGEHEAGVLADLDDLPPEAKERTLAKTMIGVARRLDSSDVADRDYPSMVKELRQLLTQIKLEFPPVPEEDDTARARRRREQMLMQGDYDRE